MLREKLLELVSSGREFGTSISNSMAEAYSSTEPVITQMEDLGDEAEKAAERIRQIQKAVGDVSTVFNSGMNVIDAWSSTFDAALQNNIDKLQQETDALSERHEREIAFAEAAGASREELAELRAQQAEEEAKAEEKLDQKKAELARKQFRRQQALNIAQAVMDTASAVAQALPNIPLSIAVGALGAAQVAGIAAQQPPAFEKGGSFVTSGPQMIQVGDGQSPRERVTVEPLSGPYKGSSGGITINISGVIGGREQVADWVNEGIRRGRARGSIR
jgi:hypothetical protein